MVMTRFIYSFEFFEVRSSTGWEEIITFLPQRMTSIAFMESLELTKATASGSDGFELPRAGNPPPPAPSPGLANHIVLD
jgi:hypothetical protein